jgi:FMN phosphatase YigB (HAD superfamily)
VPILDGPILETPRAIIFDIGRVIIKVNFAHSSAALGQNSGLSEQQIIRRLEADPRWADWQEGRMTPREWHKHFCERFQISLDFEEFCASWNRLLEPETILPELLFERLGTSCRLALLSNTDPIHVAHIEATFPFVRFFPVRVYSCRIGSSKPQPLIYHHALRELDASPEEAIYIDDIRENAVAAARLGMIGFHFIGRDELLSQFSRLGLWAP